MSNFRRDLLNPDLKDILETFQLDKDYVHGEGTTLTDSDGNQYLDFIAQYGAVPFGYNPSFVWEALERVRKRALPSLVQPSLPGEALRLANLLAECSPGDLCYCTFCQSGTEAVEAAIKLARAATGKEMIISTGNSFHGKTLGALSATGKDSYQTPFRAPAPGFVRIPYNDIAALEQALNDYAGNVAAFIVEPVQGEGGIVVAAPGYLQTAQQLCNTHGVVFIVDEVQTGLGRTGRLFACEHEQVEPDVLLLAKALGGGLLPLGVCLSSPRVWNEDFAMLHSSTFANNGVTCAVGIAVLEKLLQDQQALVKEVQQKGDYLLAKTRELQEKYPQAVKEVRGQGLMVGLEFHPLDNCGSFDLAYLADQGGFTALLSGFLLNVYGIRLAPFLNNSMTLRLEPTLTITCEEIDRVIKALEVCCQIMSWRDYSKLYRYLLGDRSPVTHIIDYRSQTRTIKSSPLKPGEAAAHKFAFIIHYPAPEDVILNNPSFASMSRDELYRFLAWQSMTKDPGIVCHMPAIRSKSGTIVEGWMIGVPFGGREIMQLPHAQTVDMIARAVDMGRDLGAEIVGLGALTSVVTRGGRSVTGRDVAITSGNSFTTLMGVEALFQGAAKMHIETIAARGGVVGATGSIGRACALMLSEELSQLTLFGNPDHPVSSNNRLQSLAREIFVYASRRMQQGEMNGISLWLAQIRQLLLNRAEEPALTYLACLDKEDFSMTLMDEVCTYLDIDRPISISLSIPNDLPECELVIATSNSPEYLIFADDLQSGAVVCDVARPSDVAPCVYERDDVLILEGGLVQYPDQISFGPNLGYRDGVSLACLTETVLLALEGECRDFSIGNKLSLETVHFLRNIARQHGFALAGLKMGNHEINDEAIEKIYHHSLQLKRAGNL
ncbi:MAG TPA: aminotransferase class III-fold pyridoxal phosphate-dependent enzyme [Syntrophomonas sp.]|nr:aminotransferase class III-fold pyridoxal phosphate-dependent enzyme [Syntrophomonas sp.]